MALTMASGAVYGTMPANCPMNITVADTDEVAPELDRESKRGCQTCQLCMAFTAHEAPVLQLPALETVSHYAPQSDRFVSVDLARLPKPPIY